MAHTPPVFRQSLASPGPRAVADPYSVEPLAWTITDHGGQHAGRVLRQGDGIRAAAHGQPPFRFAFPTLADATRAVLAAHRASTPDAGALLASATLRQSRRAAWLAAHGPTGSPATLAGGDALARLTNG